MIQGVGNGNRLQRIVLAAVFVLAPALVAASSGSASHDEVEGEQVLCYRSAATKFLNVVAVGDAGIIVRRAGPEIWVFAEMEEFRALPRIRADHEIKGRRVVTRIPCDGGPTVTNVDRIKIFANFERTHIELGGGPFAPGATNEGGTSSEIEFTIEGGDNVRVIGTGGRDHFWHGRGTGGRGLNLNPGPNDHDVELAGLFYLELLTVRGNDVVKLGPGSEPLAAVFGGRGDDALRGGPGANFLFGGRGDDLLLGRGGRRDFLYGGRGADKVFGGAGRDAIFSVPDGSRDTVHCGTGRDRVGKPDRMDRLRGCEETRLKGLFN